MNRLIRLLLVLSLSALVGCDSKPAPPPLAANSGYELNNEFKHDVTSNREYEDGEFQLSFKDLGGQDVKLESFVGKKNVLLVMTRGFNGFYCPYCVSQTVRLVKNAAKFDELETQVVVVFPGASTVAQPFREGVLHEAKAKQVPFPLVIDEDFAAVDKLKLRADLAAPSTFILDKAGKLRFAYVGKDNADRPSLKLVLEQLELIQKG